jgi:hypothetical protein
LGTLLRQVAPTWLAQMPWLIGEDEARGLQQSLQFVRPERMLREFAVLIEALTADTPLVLVLEDLHWSDASSIDVLSMLGERDEKARLQVIGTYRPADAAVREHPMPSAMRTIARCRPHAFRARAAADREGPLDAPEDGDCLHGRAQHHAGHRDARLRGGARAAAQRRDIPGWWPSRSGCSMASASRARSPALGSHARICR